MDRRGFLRSLSLLGVTLVAAPKVVIADTEERAAWKEMKRRVLAKCSVVTEHSVSRQWNAHVRFLRRMEDAWGDRYGLGLRVVGDPPPGQVTVRRMVQRQPGPVIGHETLGDEEAILLTKEPPTPVWTTAMACERYDLLDVAQQQRVQREMMDMLLDAVPAEWRPFFYRG